jgi:hypothetical protein
VLSEKLAQTTPLQEITAQQRKGAQKTPNVNRGKNATISVQELAKTSHVTSPTQEKAVLPLFVLLTTQTRLKWDTA